MNLVKMSPADWTMAALIFLMFLTSVFGILALESSRLRYRLLFWFAVLASVGTAMTLIAGLHEPGGAPAPFDELPAELGVRQAPGRSPAR